MSRELSGVIVIFQLRLASRDGAMDFLCDRQIAALEARGDVPVL
jgi:hypothetical protein